MEKKKAKKEKREKEPSAMAYIGEISLSLSFDLICRKMLDFASNIMGHKNCAILLIDEESQELYVKSATGYRKSYRNFRVKLDSPKGLIPHAARKKKTIYVPDVTKEKRYLMFLEKVKSELIIPLQVKGKVFGVINVESEKEDGFSPHDIKMFEMLASTASIAMENSRLFEKLSSLKRFNENIVLSMEEGILLEDENGIIKFINPKVEEMLGYTPSELLGKHWSYIVAEEYREKVESETKKRPKGIKSRYEAAAKTKDGKIKPIIISARPLFEEKKYVGVLSVFTDATEIFEAEREMKKLKEFRENILKSTPIGIFTTDAVGKVTSANATVLEILGSPSEEETKKFNVLELSTIRAIGWDKIFKKVLSNGQSIDEEAVYTSYWGKKSTLRLKCIPLYEKNKITGLVGIAEDITEKKKVEEALHESEERYRNLFQNSPIGIYRISPDGRILMVNPALAKMLGFSSSEELILRNNEEKYEPRYEGNKYKEIIEWEGEVVGLEEAWVKNDGSIIFVRENARAVRGEDGKMLFYEGTVEDITERNKAEEGLRESEEKYRQLIDNSLVGIYITQNHVIKFINQRFAEMFGFSNSEELIGTHVMKLVAPEDWNLVDEQVKLRESGKNQTAQYEFRCIKKDGTVFNVEVLGNRIIYEGNPAIQGTMIDITERKHAEERVRNSEEKYRSLFENVFDGIYRSTPEGRLLIANPALVKMLGFDSEEELLSVNVNELYFDPEDRDSLSKMLSEKGEIHARELTLKRKNGERLIVLENAHATFDERGDIIYFEGTLTDITDRKKAEEGLSAIFSLSQEISLSKEFSEIARIVFDCAKRILNFDNCVMMLVDEEKNELYVAAREGFEHDVGDFRFPLDSEKGTCVWVANNGVPRMVPDVSKDDLYLPGLEGAASELAVPMKVKDKVIGVLDVESRKLNAFIKQDVALLSILGNSSAVSLQNLRLLEKEREDAANIHKILSEKSSLLIQLSKLFEVSNKVTELTSVQETLDAIVNAIVESGTWRIGIISLKDEKGFMRRCAFAGLTEEEKKRLSENPVSPEIQKIMFDQKARISRSYYHMHGEPTLRALNLVILPSSMPLEECIDWHPEDILFIPFYSKEGEIVGYLNVDEPADGRRPTEESLKILETFANNASVAIENARLLEKEKESARRNESLLVQISKLFEVSNIVTKLTSLQETMDTIVNAIRDSGTWRVAVIALKDEKGYLWRSAFAGVTEEEKRILSESPFSPEIQKVLFDESARISHSYYHIHGGPTMRALDAVLLPSSMSLDECVDWNPDDLLVIPFYDKAGSLLGYLCVDEPTDGRRPTEETIKILETFANNAAVAIENARLYTQTQREIKERMRTEEIIERRAKELAALYETSLEINAQPDLSTLLRAIVKRAANLLGAPMGGLYLIKPDGNSLELVVSHDMPHDFTGTVLQMGEGLSGRIAQTGEPLMVEDYSHWDKRARAFEGSLFHRVLGVPLKLGKRIIGVLNINDDKRIGSFSEDDIRLVSLFADQAAIAIENARLYKDIRETRDHLKNIVESSAEAIIAADNEGRIRTFNRGAEKIFGYSASEMIGKHVLDYYPKAKEVMKKIRMSKEKKIIDHETEAMGIGGEEIPISISATLLYDDEGNPIGSLGVFRDLREKKKMEEKLSVIYDISREISVTMDVERILEKVMDACHSIMNFKLISIRFIDEEKQELYIKGLRGHPGETADLRLSLKEDKGITTWVVKHGESLIVPDVSKDPRYYEGDPRTKSELAVPLKVGERIIGVFNVESERLNAFSEDNKKLLETLASQTAIAIENAQLLEKEKESARKTKSLLVQLSKLFEVSNTVTKLTSLQETLDAIVNAIKGTGTWGSALISLKDEKGFYNRCAFSGLTEEQEKKLSENPISPEMATILFDERMRISRSFYHPHDGPTSKAFDIVAVYPGRPPEAYIDWNPEDLLVIPFYDKEGNISGYLNVDDPTDGRRPTTESLRILETFANTIAVAIQNARLFEGEKKNVAQLSLINDLGKKVTSTLNISEIAEMVVSDIQKMFGFYSIELYLKEEDRLILAACAGASSGILEAGRFEALGDGMIGWTAKFGKTLLANDVTREEKFIRNVLKDTKSELCIPLRIQTEVVGVLNIEADIVNAFGEEEVYVLETLSGQIASSIKNARLYGEIRDFSRMLQMKVEEKSSRTEALLETSYALRQTTSWEVGLKTIVEGITKGLKIESATLLLVNEKTDTLDYKTGIGVFSEEEVLRLPLSDTRPVAVKCVKEKKPINIKDAYNDPRVEMQVGITVPSFAWVPILSQNEALGAICVANPQSKKSIGDEDIEMVSLFANTAALFLEKTRYLVFPATEKRLATKLKFNLPPMEGYLILEEKADKAFEIFCDLATHDIQGFCVSRLPPDIVRKKYGLEKTPIMWLSHAGIKESIDPQDLGKMNHIVTEFLHKAEDAVVLLEGLEYLITENDFPRVIKALHALSDAVVLANARLLLPFNPKTIGEKELSILEREFTVFKS